VEEPVEELVEEPPAIVRQTRGVDSSDPVWRPIGPAARRVDVKSAIKMVSAAFARRDEEPEFDIEDLESTYEDKEPAKTSLPAWFGAPAPSPVAVEQATADEPAPKKRRRSLMPAVVAAVVIAAIFGVAPRVPDAFNWVTSFFVSPPPPSLGQTKVIAETTAHPTTQMMVGRPVTVKSANGITAGKGQHLVGVRVQARIKGTSIWSLPVATGFKLVDNLGVSHAPDTKVTRVSSGKVLPKKVALGPGRVADGMVVFAIPNGRQISSVQVTLDPFEPANVWNAATSAK